MIRIVAAALAAFVVAAAPPAGAQLAFPFPDARSLPTAHRFDTLVGRLERAIEAHGLLLVARASASQGAAARGLVVPGNAVLMAFRNDFALRMLAASVPAGIEAPIRFYVTENADGGATISWRSPTGVFAPYASPALDELARELDPLFEAIARDAAGG